MTSSPCRARFARRCFPLVLLVTLAGCATNPVTGEREFSLMSEAQEIQIGQEMDLEVQREMGLYDDRALQDYVERIGLQLARSSERPNLPWHFAIVDVPAINAFALPGGFIYLTRGILPYLDSEAELAGVLGHEIGHVTARHAARAYTRATGAGIGLTLGSIFLPGVRPVAGLAETALSLLFLKHSREDELQADRLGAQYAARNDWDPAGVPGLLSTLQRIDEATDRRGVPNWAATHPTPEDRVVRIQTTVAELKGAASGNFLVDRAGYLKRIDGMVFGDNPEDGILRGSAFLHPVLRFALQFPEGWEVQNGKTQVAAKEPGSEAYLFLQLVPEARGSMEDVAVRSMRDAGYRQIEGGPTSINGLDAYVGTYQGNNRELGAVLTRAAHIASGRNVYLVAGITKRELFESVDRDFSQTLRSFRALSRDEAADIRPNRIDLYIVRPGDTWQSIAQRTGQANVTASTLAIMNNSPIDRQPEPGAQIKVVVAG